jgi:hypothetical protein
MEAHKVGSLDTDTHSFKSFFSNNCSTLGAFQKANITCMLAIEKSNKQELLDEGVEETVLRHRQGIC